MENHKAPGEEFVDAVCEKVRFTPARKEIAAELQAHLEDRAEMLIEHGVPPEDAARRAVEAMGDPAEIGAALDKEHDPFWGWTAEVAGGLICLVLILFLLVGWIAIIPLDDNFDGSFASSYSLTGMDHTLSMFGDEDIICRGSMFVLLDTKEYWLVLTGAGLRTFSPVLQWDAFVIYKNPFAHQNPRFYRCVDLLEVEGPDGPLDAWALAQAFTAWQEGEGPRPDIPEELIITLATDLGEQVTLRVPMTWRNGE